MCCYPLESELWTKTGLSLPSGEEDRSLSTTLPPIPFDQIRVEIAKWEQRGGGLAEIQVLSTDGRNLAPSIAR